MICFRSPDVLQAFGTDSTPQQFLGVGQFAVRLFPEKQVVDAYGLLTMDNVGGWNQCKKQWTHIESKEGDFWYFWKSYGNRNQPGFRRKIGFEVAASESEKLVGRFGLITYYWLDGHEPKRFGTTQQYQSRTINRKIKGSFSLIVLENPRLRRLSQTALPHPLQPRKTRRLIRSTVLLLRNGTCPIPKARRSKRFWEPRTSPI